MKKHLFTLLVALVALLATPLAARAAETVYLVGAVNGWNAAAPITLGNEQEGWYCYPISSDFGTFKLSTRYGDWTAFDAGTRNATVTATNTITDLDPSNSGNSSVPSAATMLYVSTDFNKIAAGSGDWTPWAGGDDPIVNPEDEYYVIVDASRTGWTSVACFWWGGAAGSVQWHGREMTSLGDGLWKMTFPGAPINVIFNDNVCASPEAQTVDLPFENKKTYVLRSQDPDQQYKWCETPVGDDPVDPSQYASGTLPILYINIYQTDDAGNILTDASGKKVLDNYVLSKDLADKNYRTGEYWLDINGCPAFQGYESVGSAAEPLPLTMKARGNFTRTGFAKKPFKLKLDKKQSLLGMTKSKHWAILAHADDNYGYLRNFTGFNLGKRMGLPWTPAQQPVEVIINGDYRGLYFLTESIRVGDDRVPVTELDDLCEDQSLISGGYLVELDNYDEENQIRMAEGTCTPWLPTDMLRVTFDTPEEYSDLQKRFVTDQFTAMNSLVAKANTAAGDELWAYLDLDDAARYYIVEEICSHTESYHGSTYLFRDRGEGQKWHFSPLWDMGNAFNGSTSEYLYNNSLFGNTWIPSLRQNDKFNQKVYESWKWFMSNCYDGLVNDINAYVELITPAAKADRERWADAPLPSSANAQPVVDNTDMQARKRAVITHLSGKINWLTQQWGSYSGTHAEPERDTTPAAALPEYAKPTDPVDPIDPDDPTDEYYVIVDASRTGWTTVGCYWWGGNVPAASSWPGQQMTALGGGLWKMVFSGEPAMVIFNDNVGNDKSRQTIDLTFENKKTYVLRSQDPNQQNKWTETPGIDDPVDPTEYASGTLPILYINIYQTDAAGNILTDADGNKVLENYVLSKDLADKDYRPGEYWLDINGCEAFKDFANVGSAAEPLPLTMKARGNFTRTGFAKKPFKLKLDKKQSLLGMTKSKHWAILAHADDVYGYLRNFTGFNLGKRMGLPWTPAQQPVEVIINGDYRGLYFLTESIRVGDDRVPVTELDDLCDDRNIVSGGYLVELDNYDEENQIRMDEGSCTPWQFTDKLRVTFDTPEEYSDLQKRFITDQFTAMNSLVAKANTAAGDELWAYLDLDDAARYYIVEEICSHTESFHGSTYLFRDRGEGQKWHFSPLWDMGNAFNGSTSQYLYDCDPFGNTWISSMRENAKFNQKVYESWKWFMSNCYDGLVNDINTYVDLITPAAKADRKRWADAPLPSSPNAQAVVDNTDMQTRKQAALNHLNSKINWLRQQWGDYNNGFFAEPERDTTPAAPLPDYAKPINLYLTTAAAGWAEASPEFKFTEDAGTFTLEVAELFGQFKIMGDTWSLVFGGNPASTEPQAVRLGENTMYRGSSVSMVSSLSPARPENSFYLTTAWDGETDQITLTIEEKRSTGNISDVIATEHGPAVYYNLQGQRISAPAAGVSIEVRDGRATKVAR